jgi:hypothetical protein
MYKFIWNRHYQAAKAPERIKREIVNKSVKEGGLGMLDILKLDESLKIKSLGRTLETRHPFLVLIKNKIELSQFLEPTIRTKVETVCHRAILLLKDDRRKLLDNANITGNRIFISLIKDERISKSLNQRGRNSLNFFVLRNRGKVKLGDLDQTELNSLRPFLDPRLVTCIGNVNRLRIPNTGELDKSMIWTRNRFTRINALSSRDIRLSRNPARSIEEYKAGFRLQPDEAATWTYKVSKINSIRHKNIVLKIAHGEIYTRERKFRFGLSEDDSCSRCGEVENLKHKFIECHYVKRIWQEFNNRLHLEEGNVSFKDILAIKKDSSLLELEIRAEILFRMNSLNGEGNYLIRPKVFVINAIKHLIRMERNLEKKDMLMELIE